MNLKQRLKAAEARVNNLRASSIRDQVRGLEPVVGDDLFAVIHSLWVNSPMQFKSVQIINRTSSPIISISMEPEADGINEDALSDLGAFVEQGRTSVPGFWCKLSHSGSGFELEVGGDR